MTLDYEAVFQKSPAPTMILNDQLEFVAANPAYLDMVSMTHDALIGTYVFDAFPETNDRVGSLKALFEETLAGTPTTFSEMPFRIPVNNVIKEQWWTAHNAAIRNGGDGKLYVIQFSENVTEQVKMREMRNAMVGELQHRVGNIFTIINAIVRQTSRVSETVPEFLANFEERLSSLMRANRQLTGDRDRTETLGDVIEDQLAVHAKDAQDRVKISGPEYALSMLQSQAIAMAVHELATNSIKYGALGDEDGALAITWDILPGNGCLLCWHETGIDTSRPSDNTGYGTLLLNTIIPSQLDGTAAREFREGAMLYSLEIGGS
jgi:PAS domain S-box-containing protein